MRLPTPPIENMTDFIVFSFVSLIAVGFIAGWATVIVLYATGTEPGTLIGAMLDVTTTILGALVGFLAGKGSATADITAQLHTLKDQQNKASE